MTFAMSKVGVSKLFPEKKALTSGLGSWNIFRGKKFYTLQILPREEFAFMSLTVSVFLREEFICPVERGTLPSNAIFTSAFGEF